MSWLTITGIPPRFFVSVDSNQLSVTVSLLESTLAAWRVSVDSKWVIAPELCGMRFVS